MKKLFIFIFIVVIVWFAINRAYLRNLQPYSTETTRTTFTVAKGTSTAIIAENLKEQKLIKSSWAFSMYARLNGKSGDLKAGTFILNPSMTVEEIVDAISGGKTAEESITIPEGFTVKDIDALLAEKGIIEEGELTKCAQTCDFSTFDFLPTDTSKLADRGGKLEGYLYPDTYYIDVGDFVPKFFLERMLGAFRSKVVNGEAADIKASGRSLHEIVTMASLIEEETRKSSERPVVSGILWKRLDENIGLYVDASNRYILNKPTATITAADLNMDSPYNLRKYRGLPPGPIASPSLGSIEAALKPSSSPYYYYLHGNDGQIHYAVTNDEHNVNRAKYLN